MFWLKNEQTEKCVSLVSNSLGERNEHIAERLLLRVLPGQ